MDELEDATRMLSEIIQRMHQDDLLTFRATIAQRQAEEPDNPSHETVLNMVDGQLAVRELRQ